MSDDSLRELDTADEAINAASYGAGDETHALPERLTAEPPHPTYYQDGREGPDGKWAVVVENPDGGRDWRTRFFTLIQRDTKEEAEAVAAELVRSWNAVTEIERDVRELVEALRRLEKSGPEGQCPVCRAHHHWDDCYVDALLRKHRRVNAGNALKQLMDAHPTAGG